MADFDIAHAALAGPRMLMTHPKVLFIWMAFNIVATVAYLAVLFLLFGDLFKQLIDAAVSSQEPTPQMFLQFIPRIAMLVLIALPFGLLYSGIQHAAAARAILRPEEERFGYLRLGADEMRVIVVSFVVGLIRFCAQIAVSIILGIVTVILLAVTGGLRHPENALALRAIINLFVYPVIIFLYLKFALAVPQTVDSKSINIFGSWSMTEGSTWKMLGTYAIVFCIQIAISIVLGIVVFAVFAAIGGGGVMAALPLLKTNPAEGLRQLSPLIVPLGVALGVIIGIVTPLFVALWYCPAAEIYGALSGRREDVF